MMCFVQVYVDVKKRFQMMFTDTDSNEDIKSTSLLANDDPCTTDCVNADRFARVKQENLTVVKQDPEDVCHSCFV